MLDLLNRYEVPIETILEELRALISTQSQKLRIVFIDTGLQPKGPIHNKPLHVTVGCLGNIVPTYLVNNGLILNVCPRRTMVRLGLNGSNYAPSNQSIQVYNNTQRIVLDVVILDLIIGLYDKSLELQVIDIPTSFNMLLGMSWTYGLNGVASFSHQEMKFIINQNKIIELCWDS